MKPLFPDEPLFLDVNQAIQQYEEKHKEIDKRDDHGTRASLPRDRGLARLSDVLSHRHRGEQSLRDPEARICSLCQMVG